MKESLFRAHLSDLIYDKGSLLKHTNFCPEKIMESLEYLVFQEQ